MPDESKPRCTCNPAGQTDQHMPGCPVPDKPLTDADVAQLKELSVAGPNLARDSFNRLNADRERLQAIVKLAGMLIQPGDNGPELVAHRKFRTRLMAACRGLKSNPQSDVEEQQAAAIARLREGGKEYRVAKTQSNWDGSRNEHNWEVQTLEWKRHMSGYSSKEKAEEALAAVLSETEPTK